MCRNFTTPGMMRRFSIAVSAFSTVAVAINFQWLSDHGITYWAEEVARYSSTSLDIVSQNSTDGIVHFIIGESIDWPGFNASVELPDSQLPSGA